MSLRASRKPFTTLPRPSRASARTGASYRVMRQEMSREDMFRVIKDLEVQMKDAARNLEFEKAAQVRDEIYELRRILAAEQKTLAG